MRRLILPSLLVMTIVLGGCSFGKGANEAFDLRKDKKDITKMSNNFTGPDGNRHVGNDITNQNPNFLNLKGTRDGNASGNSQSISKDVSKAKEVIRDTHEFTTNSVWVNAGHMYVDVTKKGALSGREKLAAEASLHKKLKVALPRYTIKVDVHGSRR